MILPMMLESASQSEITTWNGIGLGSLIMIAVFVFSAVGFAFAIKRNRREDEKAAKDRAKEISDDIAKITTALEPRLVRLEDKASDFLRKSEITAMVDHEKANRTMAFDSVRRMAEQNAKDIVSLQIVVGKVEEKHRGLENDVHEIKDLMREHRKESNEKLDKMMTTLSEIGKRVP